MSNNSKKKARKVVKRTAKAVKKFSRSFGPVLAGIAAGLAARDVSGSERSYLEDVGKDFARLLRTIGHRAVATVQPSSDRPSGQADHQEHAA